MWSWFRKLDRDIIFIALGDLNFTPSFYRIRKFSDADKFVRRLVATLILRDNFERFMFKFFSHLTLFGDIKKSLAWVGMF